MYIENIKIKNFRKIENINLSLNKNINIFIGNNAQGKTSILESIYVLALTKSSRGIDDLDLINRNSNFSIISGVIKKNKTKLNLEVVLEKNKKTLKCNKQIEQKISNYLSYLNVIMFSPDDLEIIKKSPNNRRNLLNIELCQLFNNYLRVLNEYNKILKIRNEYLRKNYINIDHLYFDIITKKLIDKMIIIMDYRERYINAINSNISLIYNKIMHQKDLKVIYERNINFSDPDKIFNFFKANFNVELSNKTTMYGAHRDDISFYLNTENLKEYGSQGQQRIAILSFKLAEINIFKEVKNSYPIILLDDIFSELDIEKRNNLLKFIKSNIQFIITTTDLKNINQKILDKSSVYKIKDGKIIQ